MRFGLVRRRALLGRESSRGNYSGGDLMDKENTHSLWLNGVELKHVETWTLLSGYGGEYHVSIDAFVDDFSVEGPGVQVVVGPDDDDRGPGTVAPSLVYYNFGARSWRVFTGVHPALVATCQVALGLTPFDFGAHSGVRSFAEQQRLFDAGETEVLSGSRHLSGHAVDLHVLFGGELTWEFVHYEVLAERMKYAGQVVGVDIEWGGDWASRDGPHFQLSWAQFPVTTGVDA